MPVVAAVEA
jgi:hypothetical protein